MAGSPGAGKTETVRQLELRQKFVVLEADEIRLMNPLYRGTTGKGEGNAHLIQKAVGIGLDYCRTYCIEHGIAFVQDATLSNSESRGLIRKLWHTGWRTNIIFVYQDPVQAWDFVVEREKKEGRGIPRERFAESFTDIVDNLRRVQEKCPGIRIALIVKKGKSVEKARIVAEKSIAAALVENGIEIPDKKGILQLIKSKMS